MKNAIGIETHQADQLVEKLNDLLANYMVFYQNTRGLHWNIKGSKFFELHLKFEELYNNLLLKVDEVAERAFQILILKQRELLDLAADANDEGTNALMSDYIREQEKMVWMYSAYITT